MQAQEFYMHAMETQADADAFRTLNEEWIQQHFRLEDKDRKTLGDPRGEIVAKGGHVYIGEFGKERVACVALLSFGEGQYELSKMAVAPEQRGRGLGRRMLLYALDDARMRGATRVFLGSNSVLGNAVRLYESVGFKHVPPEDLPYLGYARADVYMDYGLGSAKAGPG